MLQGNILVCYAAFVFAFVVLHVDLCSSTEMCGNNENELTQAYMDFFVSFL